MKSIDILITCPHCNSTDTRITVLGGDKWLIFCEKCCQDSTITDAELEQAKQSGREVKGQPWGSSRTATKAQKTNPLIADAQRRIGESETTNPMIENAKKRAEKAEMEVQNV
ncbi:MAG: hypothetical protein KAV69_00280 [Deltaproteobacteria bacterium]|nr:hypothetical protein [Deltaproteobacteria bacterium]